MKRFNVFNAASLSALSLVGPGAALAQQSAGLEEIIVTAQKRSESIQEVPLSITALSSDVLEQRSVQSFADYGNRIPNLAFANTGDGIGTSRTISIRGISGDGVTGFYLDETPLPDSIDPRIVDIDRIEVLRGPQGTLYGARSMGGTVRLLTKQPDTSATSGRVHLGISDTANASDENYFADGAINVPLGESVAVRGVGFYEKDAGFFKRKFCESPADVRVGHVFPEFERRSAGRHRRQRCGARVIWRRGRAEVAGDGRALDHAALHVPEGRIQRPAARRHFRGRGPRGLPGASGSIHAARTHPAQPRAAPVLRYRRRRFRPLVARDARDPVRHRHR
jgi:hypothetical protein